MKKKICMLSAAVLLFFSGIFSDKFSEILKFFSFEFRVSEVITFSNGEKPAIPKKVSFSLLKIP